MLTQEMCTKLREKGYPQGDNYRSAIGYVWSDGLYEPTLSEVIRELGDLFYGLHYGVRNAGKWYAAAKGGVDEYGDGVLIRSEDCDSPEEAVCSLWILLKENPELITKTNTDDKSRN